MKRPELKQPELKRPELQEMIAQPTTDSAPAVAALNHCFEGYLTPVNFTVSNFEQCLRGEYLDPESLAPKFFSNLGFSVMSLDQFEMRHPLER